MKRAFWITYFSSNVGRPLSYFQVIISKQRVLLFKFYFKDQRCEDVSMNSMIDHPSSQESAIVVTILMIIVITVYDNHHHIWWWWSASCRRWSSSLLWMTMNHHDDHDHHSEWWWWGCQEDWGRRRQDETSANSRKQLGVWNVIIIMELISLSLWWCSNNLNCQFTCLEWF